MAEKNARLPGLDQYEWASAEPATGDAVILKLIPKGE
jgi:hypothetical protein